MKQFLAVIAALLFLAVLAIPAQAKVQKQTHVSVLTVEISARHKYRRHVRHYRHHARKHYARHRGACDGFQRCRCGTTAARYHGLPYNYNGHNLKLAAEWGRTFPRTSFGIGVVGVKPHHVLTVVGGSTCQSATVHDDAGTYQRNVCGMTFVSVGGYHALNSYAGRIASR